MARSVTNTLFTYRAAKDRGWGHEITSITSHSGLWRSRRSLRLCRRERVGRAHAAERRCDYPGGVEKRANEDGQPPRGRGEEKGTRAGRRQQLAGSGARWVEAGCWRKRKLLAAARSGALSRRGSAQPMGARGCHGAAQQSPETRHLSLPTASSSAASRPALVGTARPLPASDAPASWPASPPALPSPPSSLGLCMREKGGRRRARTRSFRFDARWLPEA